MKPVPYEVTIKTVKGVELRVPHVEVVQVQEPETMEDVVALCESLGVKAVCKTIVDSLKLKANGEVRRRLENQDSPKAGRAMAQAWIFSNHVTGELGQKLISLLAQGTADGFLEAVYQNHGEAIREYHRNKSNTYLPTI